MAARHRQRARLGARAVNALVEARATLLGLWGDKDAVHLALLEEPSAEIAVFTLECPDGKFPSVGVAHPPAIRLERAIRDLYGLKPAGAADTRAWLDLGFWGVSQPLGANKKSRKAQQAYAFLPVEGEDLHQIPVGPVHAGIIEPGHFRFTANGEAVVRLEERLGYVHKGIDGLMTGADLDKGAKLAGRVSGDSTVAYAIAFAQAVESALRVKVPERAVWLRALMAELERIANHCGDIGAICNDASFSILQADFAILRERVLRAADACFGHRLMRDRIVPGGVTQDVAPGSLDGITALIETIRGKFPELVAVYDNTASLQDRTVTTGYLSPTLARAFGAGGYVGRASGRAFDARKASAMRLTIGSSSRCRCATTATSMRASGSASARSSRACGCSSRSCSACLAVRSAPQLGKAVGAGRGACSGRGLPRRSSRLGAPRRRRQDRALPFARRVLVPMAAARGLRRRQHRRRLPALQQIVQLLLFGPRSLEDAMRLVLKNLLSRPVTEAAPAADAAGLAELAANLDRAAKRRLGRSLAIREVDAGSCNGCELEIHALNNAFYDLERFGLKFVASPRHADVLLVTGPVTKNMREALLRTYNATPDPKWVVAVGDCAANGGIFAGSYAVEGGVPRSCPSTCTSRAARRGRSNY